MRISTEQLRQIVLEELQGTLKEATLTPGDAKALADRAIEDPSEENAFFSALFADRGLNKISTKYAYRYAKQGPFGTTDPDTIKDELMMDAIMKIQNGIRKARSGEEGGLDTSNILGLMNTMMRNKLNNEIKLHSVSRTKSLDPMGGGDDIEGAGNSELEQAAAGSSVPMGKIPNPAALFKAKEQNELLSRAVEMLDPDMRRVYDLIMSDDTLQGEKYGASLADQRRLGAALRGEEFNPKSATQQTTGRRAMLRMIDKIKGNIEAIKTGKMNESKTLDEIILSEIASLKTSI